MREGLLGPRVPRTRLFLPPHECWKSCRALQAAGSAPPAARRQYATAAARRGLARSRSPRPSSHRRRRVVHAKHAPNPALPPSPAAGDCCGQEPHRHGPAGGRGGAALGRGGGGARGAAVGRIRRPEHHGCVQQCSDRGGLRRLITHQAVLLRTQLSRLAALTPLASPCRRVPGRDRALVLAGGAGGGAPGGLHLAAAGGGAGGGHRG